MRDPVLVTHPTVGEIQALSGHIPIWVRRIVAVQPVQVSLIIHIMTNKSNAKKSEANNSSASDFIYL